MGTPGQSRHLIPFGADRGLTTGNLPTGLFSPGFGDVFELSGEILMSDQDSHGRSTLPQAFLGMLSNGAEQVVDDAALAGLHFCGDG